MEKIKNRLDAFSDAIIAIIITIMVLELPFITHHQLSEFLHAGQAIGIFFISFCFVANYWYQHAILFNEINDITPKIIVFDLIFLALLSLIPYATKLMTVDVSSATVIAYGILNALIILWFRVLARTVIHYKFIDKADMRKVYEKIYKNSSRLEGIGIIALLIIAYFYPKIALVFFLAYPVVSFLSNLKETQELDDTDQLSRDLHQRLARSDRQQWADYRKYYHQLRLAYQREYGHIKRNDPNYINYLNQHLKTLQPNLNDHKPKPFNH